MIPQDTLSRLDAVISQARATGNTKVLAEAIDLLGQVLRHDAGEAAEAGVSPADPDPITRARVDSDDEAPGGLRKLRKGRDRCSAKRRDGQRCQAPAIEEGTVCRRHGGASPQAQIKAKHRQLQMAVYTTTREFEEARGTSREFDRLCKAQAAQRDLDAYEVKLRLLAELRAEVRRQRTGHRTQAAPD